MVFIQMDCTARMHPPLDDIRAAAAASPTTSSSQPLWNLDRVPPALDALRRHG
jgi:hypothetical protein